jgi:hypothetical protein
MCTHVFKESPSAAHILGGTFHLRPDCRATGVCGPMGNRPRLKCSPPLAFGLGTASQNFSAEKFCSGVRFLYEAAQKRTCTNRFFFVLWRLLEKVRTFYQGNPYIG